MAKIEQLTKLLRTLERLERQSKRKDTGDVVVGYATSYALYVHENKEARHEVGQAKYLEEPARTMQPELKRVIRGGVKSGIGLTKSLLIAGQRLQRESQQLVPVDTGSLKGSAFTEKE